MLAIVSVTFGVHIEDAVATPPTQAEREYNLQVANLLRNPQVRAVLVSNNIPEAEIVVIEASLRGGIPLARSGTPLTQTQMNALVNQISEVLRRHPEAFHAGSDSLSNEFVNLCSVGAVGPGLGAVGLVLQSAEYSGSAALYAGESVVTGVGSAIVLGAASYCMTRMLTTSTGVDIFINHVLEAMTCSSSDTTRNPYHVDSLRALCRGFNGCGAVDMLGCYHNEVAVRRFRSSPSRFRDRAGDCRANRTRSALRTIAEAQGCLLVAAGVRKQSGTSNNPESSTDTTRPRAARPISSTPAAAGADAAH